MEQGQPSRTALGAAMHRAAHQVLESGSIFADPFAEAIIGAEARQRLAEWASPPQRRGMRLFIAARHRMAADRLAEALASGIEQVVIVGAGLDTTALRLTAGRREVRLYEVDHPATQAWKRERLAAAGLASPPFLSFAPVDFERQTLGEGLAAAGFDGRAAAFFIWLGVVPYLTEAAILATLRCIAAVPGAQLVFDYANPPEQLEDRLRQAQQRRAARVAAIGEPWISYFDSEDRAGRLRQLGAVEIDDLGPTEIQQRIFGNPDPQFRGRGGHIAWVRWP